MKTVMVRYKVKAARVEENRGHIERVFAALARNRPQGLCYAAFCLPDGVSFVHLAAVDGGGGNPLPATPEFQAFIADIGARRDEPPQAVELGLVGSYRLVDG